MAKVHRTKDGTVYRTRCDNHPERRAAYSFTDAATDKRRGLCTDCFDEERRAALKHLRIQRRKERERIIEAYERLGHSRKVARELDIDQAYVLSVAKDAGILRTKARKGK